jgi:hypothetical protein
MAQTSGRIEPIIRVNYPQIGGVVEISPVNAGHISKTYRIATDAPAIYILKAKPGNLFDPQTTVEMHRFLAYLEARGLPVPHILPTTQGRTIVQDETTIYELQTYIKHDGNLDDREYADVSLQLFVLLGRYHRISAAYPHSFARVAYLGDSTLPIGLFAKYVGGALDHAIPRGIASASDAGLHGGALLEYLHGFADRLRAIQAELARKIEVLPQVINHNDIYGNNLLFLGGQLVGLVDFDFCMTEIYYLDLVEALHYSALLRASEYKYFGLPPDGQIRARHGIDDLRAYFAENPGVAYDGRFLVQLLTAKVISLALFPLFEVYPQVEERLEMYRRVRRVAENLQDLGEFEL